MVDALATVAARLGSASNVTANSTSFTTDSRIYQATYVSGKWIGEMSAWDATASGLADHAGMDALRVRSRTPAATSSPGTAPAAQTFPTTAQTSALTRTTGIAPVTGANNVEYIKGNWASERRMGGTLRNRDSLLGDIVNSSPMYAPDTKTLFVGANDGMLHAFNALTGAELFTFVPAGLNFADLATLSDPQYTHKYFVDGPVVVSNFKQTPGKNYLVGALGRGGKGIFGLDVTSPSSFAAANVLWELRDDGGDMGMVINEPQIITLNDSTNTKAVMFGNGINSANGHAVLFIVNLPNRRGDQEDRYRRRVGTTRCSTRAPATPTATAPPTTSMPATATATCGSSTSPVPRRPAGPSRPAACRCTPRAAASRSPRASPWRRTRKTVASGSTSARAATSRSATSTTTRCRRCTA